MTSESKQTAILDAIFSRQIKKLSPEQTDDLRALLTLDENINTIVASIKEAPYYSILEPFFRFTNTPAKALDYLRNYFLRLQIPPSPVQQIQYAEMLPSTIDPESTLRTMNEVQLFVKLNAHISPHIEKLQRMLSAQVSSEHPPIWLREQIQKDPDLSSILHLLPKDLTTDDLDKLRAAVGFLLPRVSSPKPEFGIQSIGKKSKSNAYSVLISEKTLREILSRNVKVATLTMASIEEKNPETDLKQLLLSLDRTELLSLSMLVLPLLNDNVSTADTLNELKKKDYFYKIEHFFPPIELQSERALKYLGALLWLKLIGDNNNEN